jgi:uncharacterized protein YciI
VQYWLVRRRRGGPWDWSRDLREQDGWDEHADIMERWVDERFIVLGGPLGGDKEVVHVIDAPSEEAIHKKFAEDNWEQDGKLSTVSIERWEILLDGREAS